VKMIIKQAKSGHYLQQSDFEGSVSICSCTSSLLKLAAQLALATAQKH